VSNRGNVHKIYKELLWLSHKRIKKPNLKGG
jgi:hypothetical protein